MARKLLIIPFPVDLGAVASSGSSAPESLNVPSCCNRLQLPGGIQQEPIPGLPLDASLPMETSCQGCVAGMTASSCAALPMRGPFPADGQDPHTRYFLQVQQASCFVLIPPADLGI